PIAPLASFEEVTALFANCALPIPPLATPSGEPLVPFPVNVESCATDVKEFGEAIVSVFPAGVIVMFEPAARVTLSNSPLRLLTTVPFAIFDAVTAPLAR